MTKLLDNLIRRVQSEGPINLADFMSQALGNPEFGYYKNRVPIGKKGDFITSPEVSQMFGELIGLWSAVCWQKLGAPSKFNFIELGPGRGTLIKDAIRAAKRISGYLDSLKIHLIETSPVLTQRQMQVLSNFEKKCMWHETFEDVPDGPFFLIGNEFLDVLPIRQYVGVAGLWYERLIGFNQLRASLCWIKSSIPAAAEFSVPPGLIDRNDGVIWEICFEARKIISSISTALLERGGVAIFIDYGYTKQSGGNTFQAVRNHEYVDPLMAPGLADLTAHVDFEAIKQIAETSGIKVSGPVTQRLFLRTLGIEQRAEQLMTRATAIQKREIQTGLKRLIDDNAMGSLFKVIALSHPDNIDLEGFGNV